MRFEGFATQPPLGNLALWETDMVITLGAVNARIALITSKPLPASLERGRQLTTTKIK